jgi:ubiquinone/menaquinone biosynthesis C-methylase UbiE
MFDDGYDSITNIDISLQSVKLMSEKYKDKGEKFKYIQMDVRAMDFPENSFDAVIDKGTFDSVLVNID